MFHPEVVHTPDGAKLLSNFVHGICGCAGDWTMAICSSFSSTLLRRPHASHSRWKTPLPGLGHSTPVIAGDKIFVTTAVPFGEKLPPIETDIRGLQIADTCFYYPEDRGISESVRIGKLMADNLG